MSRGALKRIVDKINGAKRFLITAHMNLEGDALGSELAVYAILRKLNKKVIIYNNDPTPYAYKFLPFNRVIKNEINENEKVDVALALDCSDISRAGKVKEALAKAKCIINIDHHISNTNFGDINWVEPAASSTCQMLFKLCEKLKIMDKNIALALYTGISTDTGNFTYSNTTRETHWVVSKLMRHNIHPRKIYDTLHSRCVPGDLHFIGKIIASLKFDARNKVCWANITDWPNQNYDLTEVVFNVMRLLKDTEAYILFKKIDRNKTRINFRSRGKVNVNRIAKFFGGGGHKSASGTTIDENIETVERKVISFVKKYTNKIK